jgi:hypothetical protein
VPRLTSAVTKLERVSLIEDVLVALVAQMGGIIPHPTGVRALALTSTRKEILWVPRLKHQTRKRKLRGAIKSGSTI